MRVYIPVDVCNAFPDNPFISDLIFGLENHDCQVYHGLFRLNNYDQHYDVINIHWPEALFSWEEPSANQLEALERCLIEKSKNSKIVVTVHNKNPHFKCTNNNKLLYQIVYSHADAFVHFYEKSIDILNKNFFNSNCRHFIIPHQNYKYYGPRINKAEARRYLNIDQKYSIILVMGAIRSSAEIDLIRKLLRSIDNGCGVLFCSSVSIRDVNVSNGYVGKLLNKIYELFLVSRIRFSPHIIFKPGNILFKDVKFALSSADIVFIPRVDALNSGLLQLGFSYGKIVLGPDIGNIGGILHKYNNPTFNIDIGIPDLRKKVQDAIILSKSEFGEENYRVATEEWDINTISKYYCEIFQLVCSTDN